VSAPPAPARAARATVTAIFLMNGFMFGSWAARIPAVRDHVGLSDGEQGLALACLAIGAVAAMPLAGAVAARSGSRLATRASLALCCVATGTIALAPTLATLCLLALLVGASIGSLDVTMNAHGVAVERRYGRPILAGFHAAYSGGGLAGGALAALAAGVGLDVRVHLAVVALACAAVGIPWSRRLLPGSEDAASRAEPVFVRPPRAVWALGALAFSCLLIEGASADWSAVYLRDEVGSTAAVGALGFASFSVAMTLGRLVGDRLVARFGPLAMVRGGGLLAAGGFGVALLAASPAAGIAGFACIGVGLASVVPIVFRAAGAVPGMTAGVALAAVSSTGYLGFLVGPPLIGGAAELAGLPVALAVLVVLGLAVAGLARASAVPAARAAARQCPEPAPA
jgi:MFS family permease